MGMCAVLGLWVCWDCVWGYVRDGYSTIGGRTAFPVFRACGGLLILQWCWSASVFIWTRYRVNYIYLFDFDPRIVSSPTTLFNEAVDNTLFFLVIMLLYYKVCASSSGGCIDFKLVESNCFSSNRNHYSYQTRPELTKFQT